MQFGPRLGWHVFELASVGDAKRVGGMLVLNAAFKARPNTELSKFINAYKSASSRLVQRMFPEVKGTLWGGSFWTKSYCLLTTGGATLDVVRAYVEGQGGRGR